MEEEKGNKELNRKLLEAIRRHDLNQHEMAEQLGMKYGTFNAKVNRTELSFDFLITVVREFDLWGILESEIPELKEKLFQVNEEQSPYGNSNKEIREELKALNELISELRVKSEKTRIKVESLEKEISNLKSKNTSA